MSSLATPVLIRTTWRLVRIILDSRSESFGPDSPRMKPRR
ncbi:hypothetical protein JMJ77_0004035, partial [Colletotrichum scovillei]